MFVFVNLTTVANIPISIQIQSHHREAIVLTMLGKKKRKSCLLGCGYSFIDLVSAMRKLMALTHALLSCLHSKLDAYVCIQFLGRLAKYLHVVNNPELYIYIYLFSSEVIVSHHLKHRI